MKDRFTMQVRILGEDLILYKDRGGVYGLIDPYCPHRRMNMIYGIPEERGLRCAYHGWCFDETGQCIEQPYEEEEDPEGRFKDKIRTRAYPVREQGGLLMAYLGPEPVPLLPAWDVYTIPNMLRDIGYAMLPCNWLQCQENSLDPVHLEWLHSAFTNYVLEKLDRPERVNQKKHQKDRLRRLRVRNRQAPSCGRRQRGRHGVGRRAPHCVPEHAAPGWLR
jgi:5,5'-dehydrodivanillate O-demethylase